MKYFSFITCIIIFFIFNSVSFAEELVLFDKNNSSDVFFVKHSLVQQTPSIRTVWIKYEYSKYGSSSLKKEINTVEIPFYSKVKYAFDCTNRMHKVLIAAIYNKNGSIIKSLSNGSVEEVIPGTVGEAIRDVVCNYKFDSERTNDAVAERTF